MNSGEAGGPLLGQTEGRSGARLRPPLITATFAFNGNVPCERGDPQL